MEYQEYLKNKRSIQSILIGFINSDTSSEEDYQNLIELLEELRGQTDKYDIEEVLHLLLKIANNHYRNSHFFEKIERILKIFEDQINKLSKHDIFNIFKQNKRILLFLFEQKILIPDNHMLKTIMKRKYICKYYPQYFYIEFRPLFQDQFRRKIYESIKVLTKDKLDRYKENRMNGENESHICYLIRNDMIGQFITYVHKNNITLSMKIEPSIYETNPFLLKNNDDITLIEYAAFFGSIQIFKYLYLNGSPIAQTLWVCGVHSQNPELINLLEEYKILPANNSYQECFFESIKCHHIEVSNYLVENFFNYQIDNDVYNQSLKYYNYLFFPNELGQITNSVFDLCKYDYPSIVKLLLQARSFDINAQIILIKIIFFNKIQKLNSFKYNSKHSIFL